VTINLFIDNLKSIVGEDMYLGQMSKKNSIGLLRSYSTARLSDSIWNRGNNKDSKRVVLTKIKKAFVTSDMIMSGILLSLKEGQSISYSTTDKINRMIISDCIQNFTDFSQRWKSEIKRIRKDFLTKNRIQAKRGLQFINRLPAVVEYNRIHENLDTYRDRGLIIRVSQILQTRCLADASTEMGFKALEKWKNTVLKEEDRTYDFDYQTLSEFEEKISGRSFRPTLSTRAGLRTGTKGDGKFKTYREDIEEMLKFPEKDYEFVNPMTDEIYKKKILDFSEDTEDDLFVKISDDVLETEGKPWLSTSTRKGTSIRISKIERLPWSRILLGRYLYWFAMRDDKMERRGDIFVAPVLEPAKARIISAGCERQSLINSAMGHQFLEACLRLPEAKSGLSEEKALWSFYLSCSQDGNFLFQSDLHGSTFVLSDFEEATDNLHFSHVEKSLKLLFKSCNCGETIRNCIISNFLSERKVFFKRGEDTNTYTKRAALMGDCLTKYILTISNVELVRRAKQTLRYRCKSAICGDDMITCCHPLDAENFLASYKFWANKMTYTISEMDCMISDVGFYCEDLMFNFRKKSDSYFFQKREGRDYLYIDLVKLKLLNWQSGEVNRTGDESREGRLEAFQKQRSFLSAGKDNISNVSRFEHGALMYWALYGKYIRGKWKLSPLTNGGGYLLPFHVIGEMNDCIVKYCYKAIQCLNFDGENIFPTEKDYSDMFQIRNRSKNRTGQPVMAYISKTCLESFKNYRISIPDNISWMIHLMKGRKEMSVCTGLEIFNELYRTLGTIDKIFRTERCLDLERVCDRSVAPEMIKEWYKRFTYQMYQSILVGIRHLPCIADSGIYTRNAFKDSLLRVLDEKPQMSSTLDLEYLSKFLATREPLYLHCSEFEDLGIIITCSMIQVKTRIYTTDVRLVTLIQKRLMTRLKHYGITFNNKTKEGKNMDFGGEPTELRMTEADEFVWDTIRGIKEDEGPEEFEDWLDNEPECKIVLILDSGRVVNIEFEDDDEPSLELRSAGMEPAPD